MCLSRLQQKSYCFHFDLISGDCLWINLFYTNKKNIFTLPEQPIVPNQWHFVYFAIPSMEDKALLWKLLLVFKRKLPWEHREDVVMKLPKWRCEYLCLEELRNGIWNRSDYLYKCRQTQPQVFLWETLQKTLSCCCGISLVSQSNYEVKLRTLKAKRLWEEAASFILQGRNRDKIVSMGLLAALRPESH